MNRIKNVLAKLMSSYSLDIGKVFGVKVGLHWSLLILMLLVVDSVYDMVLVRHPLDSHLLVFVLSALIGVGLVASILAHELGHVLVGKRLGIKCSGIKLFLLGGVANMSSKFITAREELIVAAAGPITSIILGLALLGLALPDFYNVSQIPVYGYVATAAMFLGAINLAVGIFNAVIPIFPMDSGRMLRAIVWMITGDFVKATRFATRLGIGCARGLILCGVLMAIGFNVPYLGTGFVSGLWIACIGWVLMGMAKKERDSLGMARS
jgi:Zn-dependent protease